MSTFLHRTPHHRAFIVALTLAIVLGSAITTRAQTLPQVPQSAMITVPVPLFAAFLAAKLPTTAGSGDIRISGVGNGASWTIIVLLTFLTLIPSLLLCMTPFARLLIVFHFLRQALGLQTTPTNQTLIGLSLVLTFFLMQPVGANVYRDLCRAAAKRGHHGIPGH